jgi:O-antigen ligase
MDHVWFGLGPGAPKSAISTYYSAIQANDNIKLAHNAFLQCAADFGLVGFSGLIVWLTAWIRVATRMSDAKRVLIVLFVLSALGGLTQNNLQESAYVLGLTTWTMIITSIEVGTRERSIRTVENQNHLARKGAATN